MGKKGMQFHVIWDRRKSKNNFNKRLFFTHLKLLSFIFPYVRFASFNYSLNFTCKFIVVFYIFFLLWYQIIEISLFFFIIYAHCWLMTLFWVNGMEWAKYLLLLSCHVNFHTQLCSFFLSNDSRFLKIVKKNIYCFSTCLGVCSGKIS